MASKRKRSSITRRSPAQKKRDEYTVVLEEIREQYKTLDEGSKFVQKKLAEHDKQLAKVDQLAEDMDIIKTEIKLIRREQVSRPEFNYLEQRVEN